MKTILVAVLSLLSGLAFGEAVILKSGERYIGEISDEGDRIRIKNETFPDGIVVKREDVKVIYPKAEELLERLNGAIAKAQERYDFGKKAADANPHMKAAIEMLFDPELEAQEAAEVYPAEAAEFQAVTKRIHELRKLCRDGQNMGGPPGEIPPGKPDPKKDPNAKPDPSGKPDPGKKPDPKTPPKVVDNSEMGQALETIKSGPASAIQQTLSKFEEGKEERLCAPMIERLKTETDAQAKTVLKDALSKYPGFVVVRTVENALKSKGITDDFRRDCCDILGPKKEEKAISIICDIAFAAESRDTREYGRGVLFEHKNACLKTVNRYIHHPNDKTRVDAVEFVARIGTPEAYQALVSCLLIGTDKELMAASSINVALRDLVCDKMIAGGDNACPALVNALSVGNLRKWAAFCLKKISGEDFVESDIKSWNAWWKRRQSEMQGR